MERVAIDVELGELRVAFEGDRAFYERLVEPLVAGAYRKAARIAPGGADSQAAAGVRPAAVRVGSVAAARHTPPPSAQAPAAAPSSSQASEASDRWRPASPSHFQQFVAQVGDRASSPDKRVMAFAFYLWNYEKRETFETGEVERFFRTVLDEPTDGLVELLQELATARGFLEAKGPTGPWALRKKGVGFVKARLLGQF